MRITIVIVYIIEVCVDKDRTVNTSITKNIKGCL